MIGDSFGFQIGYPQNGAHKKTFSKTLEKVFTLNYAEKLLYQFTLIPEHEFVIKGI